MSKRLGIGGPAAAAARSEKVSSSFQDGYVVVFKARGTSHTAKIRMPVFRQGDTNVQMIERLLGQTELLAIFPAYPAG